MSRVEVYIEDEDDGVGVGVKFAYMGEPFNRESMAHQLAGVIRRHLDETLITRDSTEPAIPLQAVPSD